MSRNKIFYSACFGFAAGVLYRSFLLFSLNAAFAVALVSAFLILFFSLIVKRKSGIFISVFILAFAVGILRFNFADAPAPASLENLVGQKISWSGIIVDEPDLREGGVKLTVAAGCKGQVSLDSVSANLFRRFFVKLRCFQQTRRVAS